MSFTRFLIGRGRQIAIFGEKINYALRQQQIQKGQHVSAIGENVILYMMFIAV